MLYTNLLDIPKEINNLSAILSIDYGKKKVGFCFKDSNVELFDLFVKKNDIDLFLFINNLILEKNLSLIIIGFPKTLQNLSHDLQKDISIFLEKICHNVNIFLADERFSTQYGINIKNNFFYYDKSLFKVKKKIINQLRQKEDGFAAQFMMEYVLNYFINYRKL